MTDIPAPTQENRRQELRFPGQRKAVVCFGKKKGVVIDVSKGGLAVLFNEQYIFPGYKKLIDIEWSAQGFIVTALPVRTISHYHAVEEPWHNGLATRCGLAFDSLRSHQRFKLDYLIWLCSHQPR